MKNQGPEKGKLPQITQPIFTGLRWKSVWFQSHCSFCHIPLPYKRWLIILDFLLFPFFKNLPNIYIFFSLNYLIVKRSGKIINYNLRLQSSLCSLKCWNDPERGGQGQEGALGFFFQTEFDLGQLGNVLIQVKVLLLWDFKQRKSLYISCWRDNVLYLKIFEEEEFKALWKKLQEDPSMGVCGEPL